MQQNNVQLLPGTAHVCYAVPQSSEVFLAVNISYYNYIIIMRFSI